MNFYQRHFSSPDGQNTWWEEACLTSSLTLLGLWGRMLQLSVPFFLEDTPGCLTWPQILSRGEVFISIAVFQEKNQSQNKTCRIPPFLGLFFSNSKVPVASHANFSRFLNSKFSHISPLKKLASPKIDNSLLPTGCFVFHIHRPFMTFSSYLLSPQIKTHTGAASSNWHLQIKLCAFCCAPPPRNSQRPAVVIHVGVNRSLGPGAGPATLAGIILYDF